MFSNDDGPIPLDEIWYCFVRFYINGWRGEGSFDCDNVRVELVLYMAEDHMTVWNASSELRAKKVIFQFNWSHKCCKEPSGRFAYFLLGRLVLICKSTRKSFLVLHSWKILREVSSSSSMLDSDPIISWSGGSRHQSNSTWLVCMAYRFMNNNKILSSLWRFAHWFMSRLISFELFILIA
jgi:hypothetical protein